MKSDSGPGDPEQQEIARE